MCGVVGIIGTEQAARESFLGLTTLQHRGQDAAGILTYDTHGFHRVKNIGLVESVFTRENMETLSGDMAIGHARYSTIGKGDLIDVQPFLLSFPFGLGMVHNGNIVNVEELAQDLKQKNRRHLLTHSDTEVVLNLFAEALAKSSDSESKGLLHDPEAAFEAICKAITGVMTRVNGSYSIVSLIADHGIIAFRDPSGIRPLVWGTKKGNLPTGLAHAFASESVAIAFNGYELERDIGPGELVFVDLGGRVFTRKLGKEIKPEKPFRPCMFEWVYFASPESVIDKVPVYGSRIKLGQSLAHKIKREMAKGKIKPDIIVPVPETSRIAAIALSEELKIPYREVLIKNRYIKRTFILDSQEKRQSAVRLKLSPVRSEIEGKCVLLVDDSIVRGTTSQKIIDLVRQAGAKEVYFVSTCPPIQNPCYYGIDFPNPEELIASHRSHEEIEKALGADAVVYQDLEGLEEAIGFKPCMACLDGNYPTDISQGLKFAEQRNLDRRKAPDRRDERREKS